MPEEERYVKSAAGILEAWKKAQNKKKSGGKVGAGQKTGVRKPVPPGGIKKKKKLLSGNAGRIYKPVVIKRGENVFDAAGRAYGDRNIGYELLAANPELKQVRIGMVLRPPRRYGQDLSAGRAQAMRPLFNPPSYEVGKRKGSEMVPPEQVGLGGRRGITPTGQGAGPPLPVPPLGSRAPTPKPSPAPYLPSRTPTPTNPAGAPGYATNLDYFQPNNAMTWPGGVNQFEANRDYVLNVVQRGELPHYLMDATVHDKTTLKSLGYETPEELEADLLEMGYVQTPDTGSWVDPEMLGGGGGGGGGGNHYRQVGGRGYGGGRRGGGYGYDTGPSGRYIDANEIGPISWRI